jgi:hypothetical protein
MNISGQASQNSYRGGSRHSVYGAFAKPIRAPRIPGAVDIGAEANAFHLYREWGVSVTLAPALCIECAGRGANSVRGATSRPLRDELA